MNITIDKWTHPDTDHWRQVVDVQGFCDRVLAYLAQPCAPPYVDVRTIDGQRVRVRIKSESWANW